ncbi:MAG: DUF2220 family protein [Thermaerobacter sp.]|nr:DUF2220 family protein [Thermaerobacter sp.]
MNRWTSAQMVLDRVRREWDRGRILTAVLTDNDPALFPMRIPLKGPTSREWLDHFSDARDWIAALQGEAKNSSGRGYRLEWREFTHRTLGRNRVPTAAVFDIPADAVDILGMASEVNRAQELVGAIAGAFPYLGEWARTHPLIVLEAASDWSRILAVLAWAVEHPRSNLYLRQVDVPGVDTKFIERRRGLLSTLLDMVLPLAAVDAQYAGAGGFERRYGFRTKPVMVRFRFLNPLLDIQGLHDLTVRSEEFAGLDVPISRVFIVENEIEFLAFPKVPEAIAIFGAGYGLQRLDGADWLKRKAIFYWGDIDTHGFAILDELRQYLPHARSILMDGDTLLRYREFWGVEERPARREATRLTDAESQLYEDLRQNRLGYNIRLEQEQIPMSRVAQVLRELDYTGWSDS